MDQPPPPPPPPPGPPPSQPPPGWRPPAHPPQQAATPPPGQAPGGTLVVHLQGSVLTSNVITPTVRLNCYPVPASYGANSFPLAPGRWHVDVSAQWLRTYGQAATDADVVPGQVTELWYAAPWHQFTTGSIGPAKQRRKGVLPLLVVALVLLVLAVGLPLLGALA